MDLHSDWAYLAAMLEGEGCPGLYRPTSLYAQVDAITNSDIALISAVQDILAKYQINAHVTLAKGQTKLTRPHWRVRITDYTAMRVYLGLILPFMQGAKRAKVMRISRFLDGRPRR